MTGSLKAAWARRLKGSSSIGYIGMSAGNFLTSSLPPTLSPAFAPGVFSPVQSQSFAARLTGGADAFKPSRDGATAMSPPAAQGFRQP